MSEKWKHATCEDKTVLTEGALLVAHFTLSKEAAQCIHEHNNFEALVEALREAWLSGLLNSEVHAMAQKALTDAERKSEA